MSRRNNTAGTARDIAIVGLACCYPKARTLDQFWENIVNKVDAIDDLPPERMGSDSFYDPTPGVEDKIYCKRGSSLGNYFAFNPLKYGTMPRNVLGAEPDQFLVLRTVYEAVEDAGYAGGKGINGERTSVILGRGNYLGAGLSALLQRGIITEQTLYLIKGMHPEFTPEHLDEIRKALRRSLPDFTAETAPGLIPNIAAGRIANRLDFMGKSLTVDAACASSLIAAEIGVDGLVSGRDDMVIAGGVHIYTNFPFLQVFAVMRALSPTSVIRPFDADCDGTMAGEGLGIMVLKRLEDAEADGNKIYAVIKGIGTSSDGKAKSVTAPRVEGEKLAVRRAYEGSGISPDTIELIEAHGTGTPVGDDAEIETLHDIFGKRTGGLPDCAVGSIKSMIGHAMPAAGAAGIIKAALSLYYKVLPPTLNVRKPDPKLVGPDSRFYVNTETRPWIHSPMAEPRRAGVNAFGFGGVNAHVILEEYRGGDPNSRPSAIRNWESELVVLEGESRADLHHAVKRLRQYLSQAPWIALRDVAYTHSMTLGKKPFRLSVVAVSVKELEGKLERADQRLSDPGCRQIKDSGGIYYFEDSPLRHGKVALLFPGEGSQYLNMMADLCVHFPEVRECFDLADEMVEDQKDRYAPSADIFPPPFFSAEEERAAEQRLWQIQRATEAVLTADGAAFTLLERLGLKADMMAGHSAGEWVALAASGILDISELLGSMSRLDHMYRRIAEDTAIPRMVMLALGAGREKAAKLIGEIDCSVHIANDNCPNQVVVVVEPKDADRVLAHIQSRGVFVERLSYDRGYHTAAFTYICEPLRAFFSEMEIRAAHTRVYCCTTVQPYPGDPRAILDNVSDTFARPLLFRQTIEAMYADGARIFVEAGPRGNLTAFVDDILRGRPHLAVAVDQYRRPAITTLHQAVGLLAALHVPLDLATLYHRRSPRVLAWDAQKDRPQDIDSTPGTIMVPLYWPKLEPPAPVRAAVLDSMDDTIGSFPPSVQEFQDGFQDEDEAAEPAEAFSEWESTENSDDIDDETEIVEVNIRTKQQIQNRGRQQASHGDYRPAANADSASGVMESHFQLMQAFLETQESVMRAYLSSGDGNGSVAPHSHAAHNAYAVETLEPAELEPVEAELVPPRIETSLAPVRPNGKTSPAPPAAAAPAALTPPVAESPVLVAQPSAAATAIVPKAPAAVAPSVPAVDVQEALLKVVSDRTGYPVEMLGLDLDMEADLGIDSIKRIEILSALQQLGGSQELANESTMEEVARLKTLRQVLDFFERAAEAGVAYSRAPKFEIKTSEPPRALTAAGKVVSHTQGQEITVVCELDTEEHRYLLDHCIDAVGSDFDLERDRLCFVPMTVSLAFMTEVAVLLNPEMKVVGAKQMQAAKWIDVEKSGPRVFIAVSAKRVNEHEVRARIVSAPLGRPPEPRPGAPAEIFAEVTVLFAPDYPAAPPADELALTNSRTPLCTGPELYSTRRMFHGPSFHGIVALDAMAENGLLAKLETLPFNSVLRSIPDPAFHVDPFLMDAAGQLVGYWPIEYCEEGYVLFPIRVEELVLYRPPQKPGYRSVCQLRTRNVSTRQLKADLDLIDTEGKVWMRIIGWEDWRFYWPDNFYQFWRFPNKGQYGLPLEIRVPDGFPDVVCRRLEPFGEIDKSIWENLWAHLILSRREFSEYRALSDKAERWRWICERGGVKEAVCSWVRRQYGRDFYPADVEVFLEDGNVRVTGEWTRQFAAPNVTMAYLDRRTVSAAGSCRLGIEIEAISNWDGESERDRISPSERLLVSEHGRLDRAEWLTRMSCAKKAAARSLGNGSRVAVERLDAETGEFAVRAHELNAQNGDTKITVSTARDGDYIIALAVRENHGKS